MIKNFYNDVEKKGFLKNVLYSDSVAEYNEILVRRGTTTSVQTFDELWKELELEYPIQSIIDKINAPYTNLIIKRNITRIIINPIIGS